MEREIVQCAAVLTDGNMRFDPVRSIVGNDSFWDPALAEHEAKQIMPS